MRLKFFWYSAVMLPTHKVITTITIKAGIQKSCNGSNAPANKRKNAAKPAVFTTVDMKAVINDGEPSYTSGVQKWKGAAPTLKHRPIMIKITPG